MSKSPLKHELPLKNLLYGFKIVAANKTLTGGVSKIMQTCSKVPKSEELDHAQEYNHTDGHANHNQVHTNTYLYDNSCKPKMAKRT